MSLVVSEGELVLTWLQKGFGHSQEEIKEIANIKFLPKWGIVLVNSRCLNSLGRSRIRAGSAPRAPSNGGRLWMFIVVEKRFQFGLISLENLHCEIFRSKDRESLWVEIVEGV